MSVNMETERKLLIVKPDEEMLNALDGCTYTDITQTYLLGKPGETERVRKREGGGKTIYTHTIKQRVSFMSSIENEETITKEEYERLLTKKDPERTPINKRRYVLPYQGYQFEIDLYPFWKRQAVMEVELPREDVQPAYPPMLTMIRDVTGNRAYSNRSMSACLPAEDE